MALLITVAGCRCGDEPGLGNASQGFRPQEEVVDFGRVLEGEQARRQVTLLATGRSSLTVTAATASPFSVETPEVTVPGSGTATVEVVFTAGSTPVEGTLVLLGAGRTESVRLTAEGVRPLPCTPSGQCVDSRFDLASGTCIESPRQDGATCIPSSRCEEQGRCAAGVCVGQPRRCDDANPCTVDACSPTRGCVTSPVACPSPSNPCKVGVCDRDEGCTEEDAADFVPCGPVDCKTASVCLRGACSRVPTPDGFVCAPATACQGQGTCQGGECERPDAGDLEYLFSQELRGEPVAEPSGPLLLVESGALYASVCGDDAGCRLVSYTRTGLLRFESPYPDGGARTLLASSDAGVVVLAPEGLEAYGPRSPGARLWAAPWEALGGPSDAGEWRGGTGAGRVALTAEGDVLAYVDWRPVPDAGEDGGVPPLPPPESARLVWLAGRGDAGTLLRAAPEEAWRGEARLALDGEGTAFLYTVDGRLARVEPEADGGPALGLAELGDGGVPDGGASLAVAGGRLLVGGQAFVSVDGGVQVAVDWDGGTRPLTPLAEPALLEEEGPGYVFARACARTDGVPCAPEEERVVLRALDPSTGRLRWQVDALPAPQLYGTFHEATLAYASAVGVLAQALQPDGPRTWVQYFRDGERLGMCPLPGFTRVAGAAFEGGRLHVVLQREGVWRLESYGLDLPEEPRGWPQRHGGPSGTRREAR